jgi:hypothetical protein
VPPNNPNRNAPAFQPNSSGSPIPPNAAVPADVEPTTINVPPNVPYPANVTPPPTNRPAMNPLPPP